MRITILGGGSWGIALSVHLIEKHEVSVWEVDKKRVEFVNKQRKHDLLKVDVPEKIVFSDNLGVVEGADMVVFAVPSKFVAETAAKIKDRIKSGATVVCASKGFDVSGKTLYDVLKESLGNEIVVLSGPTHAEEVVLGKIGGAVVASDDLEASEKIKGVFETDNFRIFLSNDPVGVQLSAAVKNVLAIFEGMVSGLRLGDNAQAFLLMECLYQIIPLIKALGGKRETFFGLAGLGDLIVTSMSKHSRNRNFGYKIGEGKSVKQALDEVGMVVEGLHAMEIVKKKAKEHGVDILFIEELKKVLAGEKKPMEAVEVIVKNARG